MKNKVFIGTIGDDTVYFDRQSKKALLVKNFKKLDPSKAKVNDTSPDLGIATMLLILALMVACLWVDMTDKDFDFEKIKLMLLLLGINVIGSLCVFLFYHRKIYPRKVKYELATKKEFEIAARNNPYYRRAMDGDQDDDRRLNQIFIAIMIGDFLIFPSVMYLIVNLFMAILVLLLCMWINGVCLQVLLSYHQFRYGEKIKMKKNYQIVYAMGEKSAAELQRKGHDLGEENHPLIEFLGSVIEMVFEIFK
ncbi:MULTISPECIES: hypothetical protein [Lactobacillus]|uniref:Uncharacterized protein n=1 Tax=Lactobacillus xujianguonis TaxID=2495899 RepID=A0A437SU30_9LACO|nr:MULTISPECIES: hypothetical protein [Lactobacillus]RVU70337.1 hypothetical protein EJK17_08155 [Lactobacillus xujianguonis]RVU76880.1 hypothetical protein EJK20_03625 [Lactobacillus xujianguonis]